MITVLNPEDVSVIAGGQQQVWVNFKNINLITASNLVLGGGIFMMGLGCGILFDVIMSVVEPVRQRSTRCRVARKTVVIGILTFVSGFTLATYSGFKTLDNGKVNSAFIIG